MTARHPTVQAHFELMARVEELEGRLEEERRVYPGGDLKAILIFAAAGALISMFRTTVVARQQAAQNEMLRAQIEAGAAAHGQLPEEPPELAGAAVPQPKGPTTHGAYSGDRRPSGNGEDLARPPDGGDGPPAGSD